MRLNAFVAQAVRSADGLGGVVERIQRELVYRS
jgi:hypothetical protein